jgi:hypothetical protein
MPQSSSTAPVEDKAYQIYLESLLSNDKFDCPSKWMLVGSRSCSIGTYHELSDHQQLRTELRSMRLMVARLQIKIWELIASFILVSTNMRQHAQASPQQFQLK